MDSKDFIYLVKNHREKNKTRNYTRSFSDAGKIKLEELLKALKMKRKGMPESLLLECIVWMFARNMDLVIEQLTEGVKS